MRKDCQHPRAKHKHGTYRAYQHDKCRCFPCRIAWSEAKRTWRSGGSYASTDGMVDRTGTVRRLQALLVIGWRHSDLAPYLTAAAGHPMRSEEILSRTGTTVYRGTADAVRAVYDKLSMQPGPSRRNVTRCRKLGYLPPLAYDDDTIDDPFYNPEQIFTSMDDVLDEVAVERIMAGTLRVQRFQRSPELVEAIHRLHRAGLDDAQIGRRVGRTADAVLKIRHRNSDEEAA